MVRKMHVFNDIKGSCIHYELPAFPPNGPRHCRHHRRHRLGYNAVLGDIVGGSGPLRLGHISHTDRVL